MRGDLECAPQMIDAFLHADQSQAAHAVGVETCAVVFHGQDDSLRLLFHHHLHGSGMGMTGAVVQSLLNDAIDAGAEIVGQFGRGFFGGDVDAQAGALGNLARLPFQRRNQPEIVEHRGAQQ